MDSTVLNLVPMVSVIPSLECMYAVLISISYYLIIEILEAMLCGKYYYTTRNVVGGSITAWRNDILK